MIELDNMNSAMKKLESDTESRKSEVRWLNQDNNRSSWEGNKLIFEYINLWIDDWFQAFCLESYMMIKSHTLILHNIMWSDDAILLFEMRVVWIDKPATIERLWGVFELSDDNIVLF